MDRLVVVHCRLLRGAEVAEIIVVDLFALECLRIFAPASYDALTPQARLDGIEVATAKMSFNKNEGIKERSWMIRIRVKFVTKANKTE